MHNSQILHQLGTSDVDCPRSQLALRGRILYKGRMVWRTKFSQSYPPWLGKAYGILYEHARELRERAVEQGLPIPHAEQTFDDGLLGQQSAGEDEHMLELPSDEEDLTAPTSVPNGNGLPL